MRARGSPASFRICNAQRNCTGPRPGYHRQDLRTHANNLQLNLDGDEEPEKARLSREELEKQLARWGIKINMIFHGDEGRRPMKMHQFCTSRTKFRNPVLFFLIKLHIIG